MILGIYYLSQEPLTDKPAGYFVDADQIEFALSSGQIKVHSTIISDLKQLMKMEIKNLKNILLQLEDFY